MKKHVTFILLFNCFQAEAQVSLRSFPLLEAETAATFPNQPTEDQTEQKNFVSISVSIGGGDYPFGGFGLGLSRKIGVAGKTYVGLSAQYFGNTSKNNSFFTDDLQIFPILLGIKQEFSRSANGKFSTLLFLDAGYIASISGNASDQTGEFAYQDGWGFSPGISFKFAAFKQAGFALDIGWMRHSNGLKWLPPVEQEKTKTWNIGIVRGSFYF